MNLREEIRAITTPAGMEPKDLEIVPAKMAITLAEAYAKEEAWETWKYLSGKLLKGNIRLSPKLEYEIFLKWWEENK